MTEKPTFHVRQVHRGFWTYDLYDHANGSQEFSVGECHSRRDAEKKARAALKRFVAENTR